MGGMNDTPSLRWSGAALASAALFGVSTPLAKILVGNANPWLLAGLLYLGSGIGLLLVTLIVRSLGRAPKEAPLRRADIPWLAAAVLAGGVAGPVLLMIGLSTTTASSSALLLNLEALATMAIAWLVFRENTGPRVLLGAAAILVGAVAISWQGGQLAFGPGGVAIAGACLAWGVDNNLTRKISNADPMQIATIKGLVAGATNFALALAFGASLPATSTILSAALLGFFSYGVSLTLFVLALRHIGAARTGVYFSAAPFIGAAISVALLSDPITPQLSLAAVLMALGVYLHLTERHEHVHTHEALDHEHLHTHDTHHQHAHGTNDPSGEPHTHRHTHAPLTHKHPHFPDLHHTHRHG